MHLINVDATIMVGWYEDVDVNIIYLRLHFVLNLGNFGLV